MQFKCLYAFVTIFIVAAFSNTSYSQRNYIQTPVIKPQFLQKPLETTNNVVYFYQSYDTLANGTIEMSLFAQSVDKNSYQPLRLVTVFSHQFFPQYVGGGYIYDFDPLTNEINLYYTKTEYNPNSSSTVAKYAQSINYIKFSEGLNTLVSAKRIVDIGSTNSIFAFFAFTEINSLENGSSNVLYEVRDTSILASVSSAAGKIILVNNSGSVLYNNFIDGVPASSGGNFAWSRIRSLIQDPQGGFLAQTNFYGGNLTTNIQGNLAYAYLDSIYNVTDTFQRHFVNYFGQNRDSQFLGGMSSRPIVVLPNSGAIISQAFMVYTDSINGTHSLGTYHYTFGLVKYYKNTTASQDDRYIPPYMDSLDTGHYGRGATFNESENLLYVWSSTNSVDDSLSTHCSDGQPNLGQLCAVDTAFKTKWIKYIKPKDGLCLYTTTIVPSVGRPGVLVAGHDIGIPTYFYQGNYHFFVYHIDQNTRLDVRDNPNAPFSIVDRYMLYPNPAKEKVVIEDVLGSGYKYQMLDAMGRSLLKGSSENGSANAEINTSNLSSGLYFIRISNGKDAPVSLRFSKL